MNGKTICKYAEFTKEQREEMAPKIFGEEGW